MGRCCGFQQFHGAGNFFPDDLQRSVQVHSCLCSSSKCLLCFLPGLGAQTPLVVSWSNSHLAGLNGRVSGPGEVGTSYEGYFRKFVESRGKENILVPTPWKPLLRRVLFMEMPTMQTVHGFQNMFCTKTNLPPNCIFHQLFAVPS